MTPREDAEARVTLARLALSNASFHAASVRSMFGVLSVEHATARTIHNRALAEYCDACRALRDVGRAIPEVRT